MRLGRVMLLIAFAGVVTLLACGPGAANDVRVRAMDFAFESSKTEFQVGKPYRFTISNTGGVAHEWMVTPKGGGAHTNALVAVEANELKPGATKTVEFTFKEPGAYDFACHEPGHYEAGMVLAITVS